MITKLRFENYRSHGATEFPLQPVSLLIGSAASGKSNVFKGLGFIQYTILQPLHSLFGPGFSEFQWVRSRWAGETDPIGFEVELNGFKDQPDVSATYTLRIADSPAGLYVLKESLSRREGDGPSEWVFLREGMKPRPMGEFGDVGPHDPTLLFRVHGRFGVDQDAQGAKFAFEVVKQLHFGYYHLSFAHLKSPSVSLRYDQVGYHGEDLPRFIASAREGDGRTYQGILESMKELLPDLEAIDVYPVDPGRLGLAMRFKGHRGIIPAHDLSDGTLLSLGLLCIALGRRPSVLCIEEPEAGMHPGRLRWLFEQFITLAYPDEGVEPTQVHFSTHSPWLIDFFDELPESVLLVEQKNGRSKVKRLVDIRRDSLHERLFNDPIGHLWATGVYEGL